MNTKFKFITALLSASLLITPISYVTQNNQNIAKANTNTIIISTEQEEIDNLANDLEFFFTKVIYKQNGQFIINENEAKKINGMTDELISELKLEAFKINNKYGVNFRSWFICMKDRIMDEVGEVVQLGATGAALLERQAWKELAVFIAKRVSKQALKRSPWLLAGIFAWHSVRCVGH